MENTADNEHPIHKLIQRRWSPRAFADDPIEDAKLKSVFEAARWAPSCYNDQPWYFMVGRDNRSEETYEKIYQSLVEGNQTWARTAPVLGLSVARTSFTHNGNPNNHARHDVGLAMENLVLEAMNQDLFVHQMAGFNADQARVSLNIPDDHEPVAAFAMGYPGDPGDLPEDLQDGEGTPRERRDLDQTVFSGQWEEPADFLT